MTFKLKTEGLKDIKDKIYLENMEFKKDNCNMAK